MRKLTSFLKNTDKKTLIMIAISALFFGGGLAFFLGQKPSIHTLPESSSGSAGIVRRLSPTPQKEPSIRISNDKQLMIELVSQNLMTIKESQTLVKSSKNAALIVNAQDIINSLEKENTTLNSWLNSKYGIEYNANFALKSPTIIPSKKIEDIDKEYKAQMAKYYSLTTEMIMQVKDKDIPEDIKKYLQEALELRKKQFYLLDNINMGEASPSATLSPTGSKTKSKP